MFNFFVKSRMTFGRQLLLVVMMGLTACGYHLRGELQLPAGMKKIYVLGASADLSAAIAQAFKSVPGALVGNVADASVILNVINEDYQRRTISISSSGYSNEYELEYRLTFDLRDKEGRELVPEETVEVTQSYFNEQSSETIISKDNEERVLREELYIKAVHAVIARVAATLKKKSQP